MKLIDKNILDKTSAKAKESPRLRMNYNFHDTPEATVNRLLNAMEPGTYLRPHRHLTPSKDEMFILLRGKVALFLFDEEGNITQTIILDPNNQVYGADIEAGVWHGMLVLEPDTVIYEIKQGPYQQLAPEDFAPWSPAPNQKDDVKKYMEELTNHLSTFL